MAADFQGKIELDIRDSEADWGPFAAPTALGTSLMGVKDMLTTNTFPSLGVAISAGQTLYLRVYPYNTSGSASGSGAMFFLSGSRSTPFST